MITDPVAHEGFLLICLGDYFFWTARQSDSQSVWKIGVKIMNIENCIACFQFWHLDPTIFGEGSSAGLIEFVNARPNGYASPISAMNFGGFDKSRKDSSPSALSSHSDNRQLSKAWIIGDAIRLF
jgi:hypothetical protein